MNVSIANHNNSRIYTVRSSPNQNNIRFIKNKTLNTRTKRTYVTAEVVFNDKIPSTVLEHMKKNGIKKEEAAYLHYIEIKKVHLTTKRGTFPNTFTVVTSNKINKTTNNHTRYYSTHNNMYTLTKGYGRRLIEYIEESLRREGIQYLFLTPSKTALLSYYTGLNYIVDKMNTRNTRKKENDQNENNQKNASYVSDNIIMFKDLHRVNE